MARLQVTISMVDDNDVRRLHVEVDEPTRFEYDRDPLYVYGRLHALTTAALEQLHGEALAHNDAVWCAPPAAPAGWAPVVKPDVDGYTGYARGET